MSLFELKNAGFSAGANNIVNDVSVSIEKGSTTGFLGKSGCGKTTILKLAAGILVPSTGKVLFDGKDIQAMSKAQNLEYRKKCSFIFQEAALWANQDIKSNLKLPLQIHYPKMTQEEMDFSIHSVCAMVNFTKSLSLRPADLSAGEQKKVAFARAMICGPEILFLDEVTASLDLKSTEIIMGLLKSFQENGNTIVYVSHNSEFIKEFQGTMHVIEQGSIQRTMTRVRNVDRLVRALEEDDEEDENDKIEINLDGLKIL